MEECASNMGQSSNDAGMKGVQTMLCVEECVGGTERIATHTMNLPRLDQNSRLLPQLEPYPISVLPELPIEEKEAAFLKRWPSFVKKL
jgi:hypothetical protein